MKLQHVLVPAAIVCVFLLTCAVPLPPEERPENASVTLFPTDECSMINTGKSCRIGLRVLLGKYISSLKVTSSCGQLDTLIIPDREKINDTLYLSPLFSGSGPCSVFVVADMLTRTLNDIRDTLVIAVYPPEAGVSCISKVSNLITHSGKTDTLLFLTGVSGSALLPVSYSIIAVPPLEEKVLYPVYSSLRDSMWLIINHAPADTYSVSVVALAKDGKSEASVTDTARVGIRVFSQVQPSLVHAAQTVFTGKSDTLIFTVDNSGRPDPLSMNLINIQELDSHFVHVLTTGSDSLAVLMTPAVSGRVVLGVGVTNGLLTDTLWYPVTFVDKDSALWNCSEVRIKAVEGTVVHHDLKQYFITPESGMVMFTTNSGTIGSDTVWQWPIPWGGNASATALVTAQKGDLSGVLKLLVEVEPGDGLAPEIDLADDSLDGKIVGSSQVMVSCNVSDTGAGVDKVYYLVGGIATESVLQNDAMYSGVISGLKHGQETVITITATDRSMKKNSSALRFTLTYDSTFQDDEAPLITHISGPKSGDRVTTADGAITLMVTDRTGVDKVWWVLDGEPADTLAVSDDSTVVVPYSLTHYGSTVIDVYVKDKSSKANEGTASFVLTYNTGLSAVTPELPGSDAAGVDTLPVFSWSGGDDADGDSVFFRIAYGPEENALTLSTGEVVNRSVKLSVGNQLRPSTRYYWKVIAYSKAFPDTLQSATSYFTTLSADSDGPVITWISGLANKSRDTTGGGVLTVKVVDPQGIDSVYAVVNDGAKTILASADDLYNATITFNAYGPQQIVIHAVDKAPRHNRNTLTLNVNYNTRPSPFDSLTPQNNAKDVSLLPELSWGGASDRDGDSVFYVVNYGTSQEHLASATGILYQKEYSFSAASKLTQLTTYYWQVTCWTKAVPDTVRSGVLSFTTLDTTAADHTGPSFSVVTGPSNGARVTEAAGSYSIKVIDQNDVDSVYAKLNSGAKVPLTGSVAGVYSYACTFTYHTNTVTFEAVDKSVNRNRSTFTRTVDYNTTLGGVSCVSPADGAVDVDTLPTLAWSAASDPDGDTVWYRLVMGTAPGKYTTIAPKVRTTSFTIKSPLTPNTTWYWRVTAFSTATADSSVAIEKSFTTCKRKCQVKYSANGGTGALTDTTWYTAGENAKVLDDAGVFSRTNFMVSSWNTLADGSGTTYHAGDTFVIDRTITLYAQWTKNSLYAFYSFDDQTAADGSGNGHDATAFNTVACADRHGISGKAFSFDGTSSVDLESMPDFTSDSLAPRTICGWFRCAAGWSDSVYMVMFGIGIDRAQMSFQIATAPNNAGGKPFEFRINGFGNSYDWRTGIAAKTYYDNTWHHAAATFNGYSTVFYIDGVSVAKTDRYRYKLDPSAMRLRIGREIGPPAWYFRGDLDNIRVYKGALNAEDVNAIYTSEK